MCGIKASITGCGPHGMTQSKTGFMVMSAQTDMSCQVVKSSGGDMRYPTIHSMNNPGNASITFAMSSKVARRPTVFSFFSTKN